MSVDPTPRPVLPDAKPEGPADLTTVDFPIGTASADGSSVLGRSGFVFLTHGTNRVLDQYGMGRSGSSDAEISVKARQNADVFSSRERACGERGIDFRQVVVPDKMSALAHLAPFGVKPPMVVLSELDSILKEEKWFSYAGDCLSGEGRESLWVKYDTHVSGLGGHTLAKSILTSFDHWPEELDQLEWSVTKLYEGDLGERFFGVPLWDKHLQPAPAKILNWWELKFIRTPPPDGKHVGQKIAFTNPNPTYDKSLLVFGGSSTNGGVRPSQLSFWFKCLFREYTFVWSTGFDQDLVDELNPDMVVCQTAERFLGRVPEA